MGIRTTLWAFFFFGSCLAAFGNPVWGVIGYIGHYTIGPEKQWWGGPVNSLGIRYSLTLALCTAIGIALRRNHLRFRTGLFHPQQKLILLFLGLVWLNTLLSPDTVGRYESTDHPSIKLTKIVIFTLMLCHVASNLKDLSRVVSMIVIATFILGEKAYEMPRSAFVGGRLESVGGADFAESNFLAAFLVGTLPLVGVQYLRSHGLMKWMCLLSGVFATNALVLARSRGAFLGLAITALIAMIYAPQHLRRKVYAGVLLALAGGIYLADEQFIQRMTTIASEEQERDESANQRLETWRAGVKMIMDYPLGVGPGNWYQTIGRYDPKYSFRDSHSTYIKLAAEQGWLGTVLFVIIAVNAFLILHRVRRRSENLPPELLKDFQYLALGFTLSLAGFLLCCALITLLYMEALWWFLVLPVCLERSLDEAEEQWLETCGDEEFQFLEQDTAPKTVTADPRPLQEIVE